MISSVAGLDALSRAQTLLDGTAKRIAQGPATPNDIVDVLKAKSQFSAGTRLISTQDEMTGTLLNLLG